MNWILVGKVSLFKPNGLVLRKWLTFKSRLFLREKAILARNGLLAKNGLLFKVSHSWKSNPVNVGISIFSTRKLKSKLIFESKPIWLEMVYSLENDLLLRLSRLTQSKPFWAKTAYSWKLAYFYQSKPISKIKPEWHF